MNIGDVVRFAELPANTIRYCKDISLVISARDDNRYRRFYVYDLHKLVFFGRAALLVSRLKIVVRFSLCMSVRTVQTQT